MKTKVCTKCLKRKLVTEFYLKGDKYRSYCKKCHDLISNEYYKNNIEKVKLIKKKSQIKHKAKKVKSDRLRFQRLKKEINEWHKLYNKRKVKECSQFRILVNLRSRINSAFKGKNKSKTTIKLLGCSIEQLKKHLESHFKPGMTWDNYGRKGWVMDHIRPCCSFDLSKKSQQIKCFHYTNLQPLWEKENESKGSKYERQSNLLRQTIS